MALWERRIFDIQMQQLPVARFATIYCNSHMDREAADYQPLNESAFMAFPMTYTEEEQVDIEEAKRLKQLFNERMFFKHMKAKAEQQAAKNGIR